jgi:Protein tyrosine and serine/threonine kinase
LTLLQSRRRAPTRWRSVDECERHCRISSNDEYCKLKCNREIKLTRNHIPKPSEANDALNEMSTSDLNLVQSNPEEFLDTEESVHGLYYVDPVTNISSTTSINKQTKDSSNLISNSNGKPLVSPPDSHKEITTATTTTVKSRRNKYPRTSLSPSEARSTVYRGRVKFSPSNMKSLEEIDSDPYLIIGQKLAGTTSRTPDAPRRQPSARRTPSFQSTTPSRSKEEELEIMEVSVAKQSSTEKNKSWKSRNIVAINNYFRRLSPAGISSSSSATRSPEISTKLTTVKYETIHTQPSISAVNNLAEGIDDVKNVFSRSTVHDNQTESPQIPKIKTIYHPAGLSSLIINVPDDATPIFFDDHRSYEQSDGDVEGAEPTEFDETTTELPDINRLFGNISMRFKSPPTLESTISSSTTTSVVKSTVIATTEAIVPEKPTKRVYTTIPRRKSTTVLPDYNRTTISTFLSNISSRRNKIGATNETIAPVMTLSTTPRNTISSTIAYKISRNFSKTSAPIDLEIVAPPSVTPESVTPSIQTNVFYQGVSTTSKPQSNEVLVEMYKMNTATYVMAGLGLLPLVVILIYVVRLYMHHHEHKDDDSENYGNDIQPISPVVTLDQSDDGSSIENEGSIISETDFNRTNLRFKSLLGEGNFGQVWKAEADSLAGHLGTTRIVAVKTERANNGQGGLKAECEIMRKLGSHSNVVTLLGACVEQGMKLS